MPSCLGQIQPDVNTMRFPDCENVVLHVYYNNFDFLSFKVGHGFFCLTNSMYCSPHCLCVVVVLNPVCYIQPMKLGEHLNSLLLNMCDDVTLSRMSLRTVLDICSKHIRNSTCDPPFSYIRKLVRLVLGSLSQVFHPFSI